MTNYIKNKVLRKGSRRLQFFILGVILLTAGLIFDKWWWQSGALVLIILLVEAVFAYVMLD